MRPEEYIEEDWRVYCPIGREERFDEGLSRPKQVTCS